MNDLTAKVAAYWSQNKIVPRTRWWEFETICRHINRKISGIDRGGTLAGDLALLQSLSNGQPFKRAISIGCGSAAHEIGLLLDGVVEGFDLHEISPVRAEQARCRARQAGVEARVTVFEDNAFNSDNIGEYDLVYWKDTLHHMFDVPEAVSWSKRVLRTGGVFYVNEFVGPTRMQYTPRQLDMAAKIRAALPPRCLSHPTQPELTLPIRRKAPSLEMMLDTDPSECADSGRIIPAIQVFFPGATIIPVGGIAYMLALSDVLANMDELADADLFRAMLLADDLCMDAGETLYAVAYATKVDILLTPSLS